MTVLPGMRHKVLAYITREQGGVRQVLVFDHQDQPEAGLQVPAGTVEPGELIEPALWREIEEEAGLRPSVLRLVRKLAEWLTWRDAGTSLVRMFTLAPAKSPGWSGVNVLLVVTSCSRPA